MAMVEKGFFFRLAIISVGITFDRTCVPRRNYIADLRVINGSSLLTFSCQLVQLFTWPSRFFRCKLVGK